MSGKKQVVYPYIPNSTPAVRQQMMDAIGIKDVAELFGGIPDELKYNDVLSLPEAVSSEKALFDYVLGMLKKNESTDDFSSFLGGGVEKHYVPALCDEVVNRPEIYSAFMSSAAADPGKAQIWWEYQSMLCDLTNTELTSAFTALEGTHAAWSAMLMCYRATGKTEVLLPEVMDPQRRLIIDDTIRAKMSVIEVKCDPATGLMDMEDLESKFTENTACVYFENPNYFGTVESKGQAICDMAHEKGADVIVNVKPISLGLLEPPANYGADITVGDVGALGVHMQCGGGMSGFIATSLDEKWQSTYPYVTYTVAHAGKDPNVASYTSFNFGNTSYELREDAGDVTSTNSALWNVSVAVYLAVMGPKGMREVGETILKKSCYAKKEIEKIEGVSVVNDDAFTFMEFVVDFNETGKTVDEINEKLLEKKIFGGHSLKKEFPEMGECALYCVTEENTQAQIDELVAALKEVVVCAK